MLFTLNKFWKLLWIILTFLLACIIYMYMYVACNHACSCTFEVYIAQIIIKIEKIHILIHADNILSKCDQWPTHCTCRYKDYLYLKIYLCIMYNWLYYNVITIGGVIKGCGCAPPRSHCSRPWSWDMLQRCAIASDSVERVFTILDPTNTGYH